MVAMSNMSSEERINLLETTVYWQLLGVLRKCADMGKRDGMEDAEIGMGVLNGVNRFLADIEKGVTLHPSATTLEEKMEALKSKLAPTPPASEIEENSFVLETRCCK